MVGQVRKFELWNEEAWATRRAELLSQVGNIQVHASQSQALRDLVL
jgi:DNA-binding transcriptional regulator/RsmH inhibitor MraZ